MDAIKVISENILEACDRYWASPHRMNQKEKLLCCLENGQSEEITELLETLRQSSDKDKCNCAAERLRVLATKSVDALQRAAKAAELLTSFGINDNMI